MPESNSKRWHSEIGQNSGSEELAQSIFSESWWEEPGLKLKILSSNVRPYSVSVQSIILRVKIFELSGDGIIVFP
jgi:hypothetical protein